MLQIGLEGISKLVINACGTAAVGWEYAICRRKPIRRTGGLKSVLVALTVSMTAVATNADVLTIAGNESPICGILVNDETNDPAATHFLVFNPDNREFKKQTFATSDVESLVITVDQGMLAKLSFDRLAEFRDAAEVLSAHAKDAAAAYLAKRLLALCAYHESHQQPHSALAKSAFKNLIAMTDDPTLKRRLKHLAYIHAGVDSTGAIIDQKPSTTDDAHRRSESDANQQTLILIKQIRNEEFSSARATFKKLREADATILNQTLTNTIESSLNDQTVSPEAKLELLKTEYLLRFGEPAIATKPSHFMRNENRNRPNQALRQLELRSVADIDFRAIQFRNGKWIRPAKSQSRSQDQ